jgi:hypothetical protein
MTAPVGTAAPVIIDLGVVGRLPGDELFDPDVADTSRTPGRSGPQYRRLPFGALLFLVIGCLALGGAVPARPGVTELYTIQLTRGWYALDDDLFYVVTGWGEVTAYGLADGKARWRADTGRPVAQVALPRTGPAGPLALHWEGFCPSVTRLHPASGVPLWTRPGTAVAGAGTALALLRSSDVGCDTRDVRTPTSINDVVEVVDVVEGDTGAVRRSITIGYRGRWALTENGATIATWDPYGQLVEHDLATGAMIAAGEIAELADPPAGEPVRWPAPTLSAAGGLWLVLTPTPAGVAPGTTITAYDRMSLNTQWTISAPRSTGDGRVRYGASSCGPAICVVLGGVANLVLDPASGAEVGRFLDGAVPLGPHPFGLLTIERPEGGRRDVIVDRRTGAAVRPDLDVRGFVVGSGTGAGGQTVVLSRRLSGGTEFVAFDPNVGRWTSMARLPGLYGPCAANRAYLLCVDSHLTAHVFRT